MKHLKVDAMTRKPFENVKIVKSCKTSIQNGFKIIFVIQKFIILRFQIIFLKKSFLALVLYATYFIYITSLILDHEHTFFLTHSLFCSNFDSFASCLFANGNTVNLIYGYNIISNIVASPCAFPLKN